MDNLITYTATYRREAIIGKQGTRFENPTFTFSFKARNLEHARNLAEYAAQVSLAPTQAFAPRWVLFSIGPVSE